MTAITCLPSTVQAKSAQAEARDRTSKHRDGILAVGLGISNLIEGLNNKVRLIIRRAYGSTRPRPPLPW